jgi:hypothetical protein
VTTAYRDLELLIYGLRVVVGERYQLINGFVRALEASEFEERLARLEEKAHEAD